jgi:hypothetical protein
MDVAFFDGHTPVPALHKALAWAVAARRHPDHRQPQPGGTANAVRDALFDGRTWRSALIDEDGETAISVKL